MAAVFIQKRLIQSETRSVGPVVKKREANRSNVRRKTASYQTGSLYSRLTKKKRTHVIAAEQQRYQQHKQQGSRRYQTSPRCAILPPSLHSR